MKTDCCENEKGLLLHAYELNILSDEERDTFETHLLECEYCIQQAKEFAPRGLLLSTSPEIKRILQTKGKDEISFFKIMLQYLLPDNVPTIIKPAFLIFLLILLSYPAYLGLFQNKKNRVVSLQEIGLVSNRSMGNENTFILEKQKETILSFLIVLKNEKSQVSIILKNEDAVTIYENNNFSGIDSFGVGRLLVPTDLLHNGKFDLLVSSDDASYQFHFNVQIQ